MAIKRFRIDLHPDSPATDKRLHAGHRLSDRPVDQAAQQERRASLLGLIHQPLQGGGYRSTLFGLSSLWRLNDAGLLGRLDRITSVSGGSILSGVLAHRWRDLQFADGRAANFLTVLEVPVQDFCSHTIDVGATRPGPLRVGLGGV